MKKQHYGILIFLGFFLPEAISQFNFWGTPDVSELANHDDFSTIFSNNPQSFGNGFAQPPQLSNNFIGNDIQRSRTSMMNQLGCKQSPLTCPNCPYRSHDGSCNNLIVPAIGTPQTPYSRLAAPNYGDGSSTPTVARSGNPLPPARLLSLSLFPDVEAQDPKLTLLSMQFGQFVSHDMSSLISDTQTVDCCSQTRQQLPQNCFPVILPNNDPQTLATGKTCMNFIRSVTDRDLNCLKTNKPAEQITEVSHFMDLSHVYGDTDATGPRLREFRSGRLMVARREGKDWLPQNPNVTSTCPFLQSLNEPCYFAGDMRTNQNVQIAALHVIMMREHNRIAGILESLNPHWNDEKLYQEARQIMIAEFQVIAYYEWLPLILGVKNSISNKLIYNTEDFVNDYDETVNPAVSNEHATAAYRFFHTNIVGHLDFMTENRDKAGTIRLSDWFNRPAIIEHGNLDFLLRGVATQPESKSDEFLTNEITQYLFRPPGPTFGDDLKAFDIQRNRDHGLASYNECRRQCGLPKASSFQDFADVIPQRLVEKLAQLYESPDDVDLVVGGSLEKEVEGSVTGPTFLCILTEQFLRTRVGDRYFFENKNPIGGFTLGQLNEIRKTSIARLFCDNGDNIKRMQPHAFQRIAEDNPVISCDKLRFVDLNAWRE